MLVPEIGNGFHFRDHGKEARVVADEIEIGVSLDVGHVVIAKIENLPQPGHGFGCVAGERVTAGKVVEVVQVKIGIAPNRRVGDQLFEKTNRRPVVLGRPQVLSFALLGFHRSPNLLFGERLLRRQRGGT